MQDMTIFGSDFGANQHTFVNAAVWDAGIERMNRFIICMMNRRLSRQ